MPFRGWRYNPDRFPSIDELSSPLFDVVSQEQREALYKNPFNSIHLSVPTGNNPAAEAFKRLSEWKRNGILLQDPLPAIYPYYQHFNLSGSKSELVRRGFICMIKAYDWSEEVVLRHENTIPDAVNDRIELLQETLLNVSATHGLYSDPDFELEHYMDEAIKSPIYVSEDYQGVKDVLGCIQDLEVIKKFIQKLKGQQIILADGHHRYEGSLTYRKQRRSSNLEHKGTEAYNYHMMYLTNMESQDLRILPTHRLIKGLENFDENQWLHAAGQYFQVTALENPYDVPEIILGKKWAFGVLLGEKAYKLKLKPEVHEQISWQFPQVVKDLDLTVMHYFIIEKLLGISGKNQRSSHHISFNRNFSQCLDQVHKGQAQLALITNEVSIDEVKSVCASGFTMPQKSTYFYPKTICGFVFASIKEDEFTLPFDFSL